MAQASCTLKARQVVLDAINGGDVGTAKWWLEKKAPEEFGRYANNETASTSPQQENSFKKMSDKEFDKLTEEFYSLIKDGSRPEKL